MDGRAARRYTRRRLLADVVGLLDALELDRVHLVAHDWGALIGFELSLARPDRVRQHLSLGVPHPYTRLTPRLLAAFRHAWYQLVLVAPVLGPRALARGRQRFPRYLFGQFASDGAVWSDEDLELFLAPLRDPAQARAGRALYRNFIQPHGIRILSGSFRNRRLTTPTLVLVESDDAIVRAEFLGGHEPYADDLEVETVDGASHWIVDERPDVVVRRALDLFARN